MHPSEERIITYVYICSAMDKLSHKNENNTDKVEKDFM